MFVAIAYLLFIVICTQSYVYPSQNTPLMQRTIRNIEPSRQLANIWFAEH